jgi:LacI family transcriptional regulator
MGASMKKSRDEVVPVKKGATVKDIAIKAGVSIGTVDRALNNRGRISQETKDKILLVAKELHYKRNEFAHALSVQKLIRIVAVYPTIPEYYTHFFTEGFERAAVELLDYGLEFTTIRTKTLNPREVLQEVQKLDLDEFDGVLINASGVELNSFINMASSKGVAVATFNSDLPDNERLFFCGEDHILGGRMSGELAARLLRGNGTIGLFCGLPTIYAHEQRIKGFREVLSEYYPNVNIVSRVDHDDIPEHLSQKAAQLLFNGNCPSLIFCNSATGALPICGAIRNHAMEHPPLVIGYDYDHTIQPWLDEGVCTALMFQNPRKQAYNALRYLFNFLYKNSQLPTRENCMIVPTIIMKYNADICR